MEFADWEDGSTLEAVSWRLASELCRRHPTTTRLMRAHPGGGQSDCLCGERDRLKQALLKAGWPADDRAGHVDGARCSQPLASMETCG